MGDIKHVIVNLCKYMNLVLDEDFKPEYFRQAKFNRTADNVVAVYWVVLYKLIPKHVMFRSASSVVDRVKLYFAALRYDSLDFYSLPDDESSGSRELLLALGYLLGECDALDTLSHTLIADSRVSHEFPSPRVEASVCGDATKLAGTGRELIDSAAWLVGKINSNLKAIAESDARAIGMLAKVHKMSKNVSGLPHLSANDVHSVRCERPTYDYTEECKRIADILEVRSKWNKTGALFWDWMLSVLSEKEKDGRARSADDAANLSSFRNVLECELDAIPAESRPDDADRTRGADVRLEGNVHSTAPIRRCVQTNAKRTFRATKELNSASSYMNAIRGRMKRAELEADVQRRNAEVRREMASVDEKVHEERQRVERIVDGVEDDMIRILEQYGCRTPLDE